MIVKGRAEPVEVHEILDYHTDETFPHITEALTRFRDGIDLYRGGRFTDAEKTFTAVLAIAPQDDLSRLYAQRCRQLCRSAIPSDWDGVWTLPQK